MRARAEKQFDRSAESEVIAAVERRAWGDVGPAIAINDEALGLLLRALGPEFAEMKLGLCREFPDEFAVSPEEIDCMGVDDRLAYIAHLVRTIALWWGAPTDSGRTQLPAYEGLGGLLRELDDISSGRGCRDPAAPTPRQPRQPTEPDLTNQEGELMKQQFDPARWTGDVEELKPVVSDLLFDLDLADSVFASKHEAFTAGFVLAERRRDEKGTVNE